MQIACSLPQEQTRYAHCYKIHGGGKINGGLVDLPIMRQKNKKPYFAGNGAASFSVVLFTVQKRGSHQCSR